MPIKSDSYVPEPMELPMLPLRDVVVFPYFEIPLFVGRASSVKALQAVDPDSRMVLLVAQKDSTDDDPGPDDVYKIGTAATVMQTVMLPDKTHKVVAQGQWRVHIDFVVSDDGYYKMQTSPVECTPLDPSIGDSMMQLLLKQFETYVKSSQKIQPEVIARLSKIKEPGQLTDIIASHLISQSVEERQAILEMTDERERLEHVMAVMVSDGELLQVERRIRGRVKKQMEKSQREYYLNEQIKAIQRELGDSDESRSEIDELVEKIAESGMPKEANEKATAELKKLSMMSPMSAEATVVRNYIDWLLAVPWVKRTRNLKNLNAAEKILDADHYGLEKVKERILEYLAVQKRVRKNKGPILCLVGPPGVGKTSLGRSVARATNRKFIRMSLGGVRDEAEIRGHRRTYVGSLPGKIIQSIAKSKHKNPLFMLDEVDKMSMDFRGDPSSALLEVLDPEQNHTFGDHYLEVEYDLSEIMFIATANTLNIPPALLDRMEVIRISGYTEEEKIRIAQKYLIPKQLKNNGLKSHEISVAKSALIDIVRYYTREAGVRALERELSKIFRKVTRKYVQGGRKTKKVRISSTNLNSFLGVRQYRFGRAENLNQVGQVTGMAWTETGGDLLSIEAVIMPGKGRQVYTGKLGKVMQESIQAAVSVVRSRADDYGIKSNFNHRHDIHVHVPEGATPKDGPSAGVAMSVAIVSAVTNIPVRADVAMTGEITLRGEVLAIGGLKEKLLAAHRGGISIVLIPEENRKDLVEIPSNIKEDLNIIPVRWIDEVVEYALESIPEPTQKQDIVLDMDTGDIAEESTGVVKH